METARCMLQFVDGRDEPGHDDGVNLLSQSEHESGNHNRKPATGYRLGGCGLIRPICALRDRLAPIVVSGLTFLAPAVSAQDVQTAAGQVPRFEPVQPLDRHSRESGNRFPQWLTGFRLCASLRPD